MQIESAKLLQDQRKLQLQLSRFVKHGIFIALDRQTARLYIRRTGTGPDQFARKQNENEFVITVLLLYCDKVLAVVDDKQSWGSFETC